MKHLTSILFSFLVFLSTALFAQTENKYDSTDYKWSKFSITMGGFLTGLSSDFVIGSQNLGVGAAINLEDALGLQSSIFVFRSEIEYNFGKRERHGLKFGYFGLFRNATKSLKQEIIIGDEVFPIGTEITSRFDLQIINLQYNYLYFVDKRVKLGASFGFFVMPVSFSTKALGRSSTATDFIAPLPVLGLNAKFSVTPKLYINQNVEFLYLKFDNFTGLINDVNIRVEYHPMEHFGFGIGYNYYQLEIEATKDSSPLDFIGKVRSGYTGLLLYGKVLF